MYINIFFFSFYYPKFMYGSSWRWLRFTYVGVMVRFFCETSLPFCFVLPGSKSSMVYIIFWMSTQFSWSHLSFACCMWAYFLLECHPCNFYGISAGLPPSLLRHHVLFSLGNRCTTCFFCFQCQNFLFVFDRNI